MDESFDAAEDALSGVDEQLDNYLAEIRQVLKSKAIVYVSVQKDSHLLEIPEVGLMPACQDCGVGSVTHNWSS